MEPTLNVVVNGGPSGGESKQVYAPTSILHHSIRVNHGEVQLRNSFQALSEEVVLVDAIAKKTTNLGTCKDLIKCLNNMFNPEIYGNQELLKNMNAQQLVMQDIKKRIVFF